MNKICTKCKIDKSLSEYNNNRRYKDGFESWCKKCKSLYYKIDNSSKNYNPDPYIKEKKCCCCKQIKPIDNYGFNKLMESGYSSTCKECQNKRSNNFKARFNMWKRGAKKRRIEFTLTLEELEKIPHDICYYTNKPLTLESNRYNTISLDRLNNSGGYTKSNVVFCCQFVNYMKGELTQEQLIDSCRLIVRVYDTKYSMN